MRSASPLRTSERDFQELRLDPAGVEAWEDGRRHEPGDGRAEVWHFDARLGDGTSLALAFCIVGVEPGDTELCRTVVNVMVSTAAGTSVRAVPGTVRTSTVGTSSCDLTFGGNTVTGDLHSYRLHVETRADDLVLDLTYDAVTEPYRPGRTGHLALGADGNTGFAVLAVPRCRVSGTVVLGGKEEAVAGEGYHDHQWFTSNPQTTWQHWILGHLYTESFTVMVFDLTASEEFGFAHTPLLGVFDAGGRLIFDNLAATRASRTTYVDRSSGKEYPRRSHYTLRDGARTFELWFEWDEVLMAHDLYAAADESDDAELGSASRDTFDAMGVRPSYGRFRGEGTLVVNDEGGSVRESGEMVYELSYPARADARAPLSSPG